MASLDVPPADNSANAALADPSLGSNNNADLALATSGEVALLEVTPLQAANDSAEEDDSSDVDELEFDWTPVSIIVIICIYCYYEFIYITNSLISEFTYLRIHLYER